MNPLKEYPHHKEILEKLFEDFSPDESYKILDAGSGRTSLYFLTTMFPKSNITALIYPGDTRKIRGIKKDVRGNNYKLIETDISEYQQEKDFEIVLAHLLLGEATKFGNNTFKEVLSSLFSIKTKNLIIVDITDDKDVDYELLEAKIQETKLNRKIVSVDKYIGYKLTK